MKRVPRFEICFLIICLILSSCIKKNHAPTINNQVFAIDENSPSGTFIGQVLAIDEDNDLNLSYSILSGNSNDAFEISKTDGKLTIHNEQMIDYETTPSFSLMVEVKDSKNKPATANVIVNLNNMDPPTNSLLLYLPFDGNLNDVSESNNAVIDYSSDNYQPGRWGQALDFNGTSDYLKLTNTINSSAGLSFSFWIKIRGVNATENNGSIVSKYNMTTQLRCFMIYSSGSYNTRTDNRLSAAFYEYGTSASYHDNVRSYLEPAELTVYSNPALWTILKPLRLEIGVWTHCIINLTPTTLESWINGVLCTKKQREYSSYFDSPNEAVYIGNNIAIGEGSNNHYNGLIDELRIYSRGLTANEINTLFKER